jgi:hypothetical protein
MVEAANETKSAKPLENFHKQTHGHAILEQNFIRRYSTQLLQIKLTVSP